MKSAAPSKTPAKPSYTDASLPLEKRREILFNLMEAEYHRVGKDLGSPKLGTDADAPGTGSNVDPSRVDMALMQLAHPERISRIPESTPRVLMATATGDFYGTKLPRLFARQVSTACIHQSFADSPDPLESSSWETFSVMHTGAAVRALDGAIGGGSAGVTMQYLRHHVPGLGRFNSAHAPEEAHRPAGSARSPAPARSPMYTLTDDLVALLQRTEIGLDIPVSEVRLPKGCPSLYIELGRPAGRTPAHLRAIVDEAREAQSMLSTPGGELTKEDKEELRHRIRVRDAMVLVNTVSGDHLLEGAYVSETWHTDGPGGALGTRLLEISLTGSPVGHSGITDDAVEWMAVRSGEAVQATGATPAQASAAGHAPQHSKGSPDEPGAPGSAVTGAPVPAAGEASASVHDALMRAFLTPELLFVSTMTEDNLRDFEAAKPALLDKAKSDLPKIELVIKALLYVGLKEVQETPGVITSDDAGSRAWAAVRRAVSGSHKRKATRNALKSYDTLVVEALRDSREEEREPIGLGEIEGRVEAGGGAEAGDATRGPMRVHWRRGHFRHQRYGQGLMEVRVIWIRPVLVNQERISELAAKRVPQEIGRATA